jgi:hypothetical protein
MAIPKPKKRQDWRKSKFQEEQSKISQPGDGPDPYADLPEDPRIPEDETITQELLWGATIFIIAPFLILIEELF